MLARTPVLLRFRHLALPLVAAGAVATGTPAVADTTSASVAGEARARIVQPIVVSSLDDLDFGIVASSGVGTVTVAAANGAASYAGSARQACSGAGDCPQPHAARFEVSGERSRNYRVAVPTAIGIAATGPSRPNGEVMAASFVVRTASQPTAGPRGRLDPNGRDSFSLGGTLTIASAMPPRRYRVTVPVVVTYD